MHPDLSPHLHSPECNEAIKALLSCHAENKVQKFFGVCNDFNLALNRCLKKEREDFRVKNRDRGAAMRAQAFENQKNSA